MNANISQIREALNVLEQNLPALEEMGRQVGTRGEHEFYDTLTRLGWISAMVDNARYGGPVAATAANLRDLGDALADDEQEILALVQTLRTVANELC